VASPSAPRPGSIRAEVTVTADTQPAVLLLDALRPLADRLADVAANRPFTCIRSGCTSS